MNVTGYRFLSRETRTTQERKHLKFHFPSELGFTLKFLRLKQAYPGRQPRQSAG